MQAVLREIREETGVDAQVVPTGESFELTYPEQVHPPLTIMVEDIHDPVVGCHQHIDMIYVCRPLGRVSELNGRLEMGQRVGPGQSATLARRWKPKRSAAA